MSVCVCECVSVCECECVCVCAGGGDQWEWGGGEGCRGEGEGDGEDEGGGEGRSTDGDGTGSSSRHWSTHREGRSQHPVPAARVGCKGQTLQISSNMFKKTSYKVRVWISNNGEPLLVKVFPNFLQVFVFTNCQNTLAQPAKRCFTREMLTSSGNISH